MKNKFNIYDKILSPVVTEKSTNMSEFNKVTFKVPLSSNKKSLKKSIEKLFKVNVTKVNIVNKKARITSVFVNIRKSQVEKIKKNPGMRGNP